MVGGTHRYYPQNWGYQECVGGTTLPPTVPPKMGGIGGTIFHDWGYCLKSQKRRVPPKIGGTRKSVGGTTHNVSRIKQCLRQEVFCKRLSRFFRIRRFVGISVYFGKIMLRFSGILGANIYKNTKCNV